MLLDGREIAAFIKQRHFEQVRKLPFAPVLAIIQAGNDPATSVYIRTKQKYGSDIGVKVQLHQVKQNQVMGLLKKLNADDEVNGTIVQLPLPDPDQTDKVVAALDPAKDVDGLGPKGPFEPATAKGIMWLLASYGIEVKGKTAVVVGQGRLVGAPLTKMLQASGAEVIASDINTPNLRDQTCKAAILVSATGQPHLIKPGMAKSGAVVVDAGSTYVDGKLRGDVDPALANDDSIKITPNPGGVGPMTVTALFDNLLIAGQNQRL